MVPGRFELLFRTIAQGFAILALCVSLPVAADTSMRSALFMNASTSTNKTSVLRIINTTTSAGTLTATARSEAGAVLGTAGASLGTIAASQTLTFTSAQLESLLGFTPSTGTAKYSVNVSANLSDFQLINYTRDVATGDLTLSQSQTKDRTTGASASSLTRSAWFMSSSTSTNKTNVLRILNTSSQNGSLTATVYDEAGSVSGTANTALGAINANQMVSYTSAELERALGFTPAAPTAKYRAVFTANLPSMELINFTKDIATGNLTLVQAQVDDRPSSTATTSSRNVLMVHPSSNSTKTSVIRIINPTTASASVSAVAYDEAGTVVGSGALGTVGANQILALTSSQIESALGYTPSSGNAKYRMVVSANVPTFEVIANIKATASGNLYLAQAQTDNRPASSTSTTTRDAYIVYASSNTQRTTQLQLINTTSSSAVLTASAYDDSGNLVASNKSLGTLGANQMLTLTSAQLESLIGYAPASGATWRLVISGNLSNFELINYAKDVASGLLVLAQAQTEGTTASSASSAYSLDNCVTNIASDVPAFYKNYFKCVTVTMSGGDVLIATNSLPPHQSYYYGTSSPNYTAFDTSRGSQYHPNPSTLGQVAVTVKIPTTPISRGLTITSSMVDQMAGTNPNEYSGSPQGISIDSVQLFHGVAAPGDSIDTEGYTFDNYNGHPAGTSYHYHSGSPGALEVLKKLGYVTSIVPGSAEVELYGMMCDGTVLMGCTELDGSAPDRSTLDAQNGHTGTITGKDGVTHFTNRYHVHICPSKWTTANTRKYTPEIQFYTKCTVTKG